MPDRMEMERAFDPALEEAGRRGIETCLGTQPEDTVTVVTDESCLSIGAAFLAAARNVVAEARAFLIERHSERPLTRFPAYILEALGSSTVTVLAMNPLPGELKSRVQIIELVPEKKLRHAHLVSVSAAALIAGMRADYHAVDALQDRLLGYLKAAGGVRVTSPSGTLMDVTFSPQYRWVKSNGLIWPGNWQNLPSGQVYTCPGSLDGTYVADRSIGDWFDTAYPDLSKHPITIQFATGKLQSITCENRKLARELKLFTSSSENADRVGEIGFGTNPFLDFMKGEMTNNENVPGVHVALGDPFASKTGARWSSKARVPMVGAGMTIVAGDRTLLQDGVFPPDILADLPALNVRA